jgi:hypothetical protein
MPTRKGLFLGYQKNINNRNPQAQIAVIITLVIALIILFTVVLINISKVSEKKVESSQVVDRGALYLASQLGSIVHTLKQYHDSNLWGLLLGIALVIGGFVIFPIAPLPVKLALVGLATQLMTATWPGVVQNMSRYNSLREETMLSMGSSLHRDNERVKRIGTSDEFYWDINDNDIYDAAGESYTDENGNGIYDPGEPFTDINNPNQNGVYDPPEQRYVLTGTPVLEHIPGDFTSRFAAWYWANRAPQVTEAGLSASIDTLVTRLKEYVDIDNWDEDAWQVTRASFTVEPSTFADEGFGNIDVTCGGGSCPSWVADANNNRIRVITIDDNKKDWLGLGDYTPFGFLPKKFNDLCIDLEDKGGVYDLSFCEDPWYWSPSCEGIADVIEDLKGFVAETKALFNKPISERTQDITAWLPVFYDINEHNADGSSVDGDLEDDIYERLERTYTEIRSWIRELINLNTNTITPDIEAAHGYCGYGVGDEKSECPLVYCCDWDDCGNCTCACFCCCPDDCDTCAWEGTYCSCTDGDGKPPVCRHGDLYEEPPDWCNLTDDTPGCMCSCEPSPSYDTEVDACDFQGWFGKKERGDPDPTGPTEVKQAIEILEALREDISEIQGYIWNFAQDVQSILNQNPNNIRNEFIYAWEDERAEGQTYGRCHLIKIELQDYPTQEEFPHLVEKRALGDIVKMVRFEGNEEGNFVVTVSTYEEDLSTSAGVLKFRKNPASAQFDLSNLRKVVNDIQDNGLIDTTQSYVDDIINNYAISSQARGFYGPDKPHIRIERLE